jgi:hypothetical protein
VKNPRLAFCCTILAAVYLAGRPAHGLFSASGEPPRDGPSVTLKMENPKQDQDWTPLLFRKEHLPMPALREIFDGIKSGKAESFERAIRASYHLMEAYGRNESHKISLEVTDFKTVSVPDALNLKFSDIISIDIPEHVSIQGITHEHTVRATVDGPVKRKTTSRGYQMRWEPTAPDPDHNLWTKRNVRQFIEIARSDLPAFALLRAVTTYRVSVTLDGKQHEYHAAFFWMGSAAGPTISTFQCIDKVVDNVTLALAEQVPPEEKVESSLPGSKAEANAILSKFFPTCNVYTKYPSTPTWERFGSDRHVSTADWHHSLSWVDASCSCGSACQSVCHPSTGANLCQDTGHTLAGYHVAATNVKMESGTVDNALNTQNGASCSGTTICGFTQCQSASCAFSITITTTGPGFYTEPNTQAAFWAFEPTSNVTCGGCTEYEQPVVVGPEIPRENCPVLISLDEGRLEMTDLVGGVRFDIDRDGSPEHNSWPANSSAWAFIALDRNRNGRIDNGSELFGNYTMQFLDDTPPNGYRALAAYDRSVTGGNGDGLLDARDAIFPSLLLWIDANHDGLSQPEELTPLAQRVDAIGLGYRESRARDRYGNQFRYRGKVWLVGGQISRSVDVFLLHD